MSKTTPEDLAKKRSDEKMLVSEMIALYCRKQHHTLRDSLCSECQQLHDYALARIEHCPFMETKTFCSACKVHCYQPEMREKIELTITKAAPSTVFTTMNFFSFSMERVSPPLAIITSE